jgi:hypothetical protein
MFVNIKSIWQPNMVYPESICPYTSSQLWWELPEQPRMAAEATSTTQNSQTTKPVLASLPRWVQSGLGSPTNVGIPLAKKIKSL